MSDLAKELSINKSCLHYYQVKKIITPVGVIGKAMIFDREKTKKDILNHTNKTS